MPESLPPVFPVLSEFVDSNVDIMQGKPYSQAYGNSQWGHAPYPTEQWPGAAQMKGYSGPQQPPPQQIGHYPPSYNPAGAIPYPQLTQHHHHFPAPGVPIQGDPYLSEYNQGGFGPPQPGLGGAPGLGGNSNRQTPQPGSSTLPPTNLTTIANRDPSKVITPGFYDGSNNWVPKYIGYLKSYNSTQGYGFISCDETYLVYKQDVFIHRQQVEERQANVQPEIGQWVEFVVKSNERGQPQARMVSWLEGKIDPNKMESLGGSPVQQPGSAGLQIQPSFQQGGASPSKSPARVSSVGGNLNRKKGSGSKGSNSVGNGGTQTTVPPDMEGKIFQGSLKSYSQQSGYGFIHCATLWEKYKRDVYVHRSEMPKDGEYRTSMTCEFSCCLNEKQQPQAKSVKWFQ